jgi:hypothetical protein
MILFRFLAVVVVLGLAAVPYVLHFVLKPAWLAKIQLPTSDQANQLLFLTVVIALAATLGVARMAAFSRIGPNQPAATRARAKFYALSLIPADASLIGSGLILAAQMFAADLVPEKILSQAAPLVAPLFVYGVAFLALHHVVGWVASIGAFLASSSGQGRVATTTPMLDSTPGLPPPMPGRAAMRR